MNPIFAVATFQQFSLPNPLINYLIDEINSSKLLKKLYKTCKYFYSKKQVDIIDILGIFNNVHGNSIDKYSIKIQYSNISLFKNKLWVIDELYLFEIPSIVINKIAKCDIKSLYLCGRIMMEELRFLTAAGKIENFSLYETDICYSDDIKVPFEDILPLIPKAYIIGLIPCIVTKHTMQTLFSIKHETKIKTLELLDISQRLDIEFLHLFLKKNLDINASVYLNFEAIIENRNFVLELQQKVQSWLHNGFQTEQLFVS